MTIIKCDETKNNNGIITIVMIIIRHLEVSMIITWVPYYMIITMIIRQQHPQYPWGENVNKPPKTTTMFTEKPTWSPTVASEVSLTEAPSETFRSKSPKKMNVPPWINGGVSGGPPKMVVSPSKIPLIYLPIG